MIIKKNSKMQQFIKYQLLILIFLIIRSFPQMLNIAEDAYASLLSLNYSSLGLAPRVVWGSLMGIFFEYFRAKQISLFFTPIFFIFLIFSSFLIAKIISMAEEEHRLGIIFIAALFLAGPYAIAPLEASLFLPDRLLALISVVGLVLILSKRLRWFLPLIIVFAMATHQMFAFTYMPLFAVVLLYELSKHSFKKKEFFFFLTNVTIMILSTLFFYFAYFIFMKDLSFEDMVKISAANTDLKVRGDMILGYFLPDTDYMFFAFAFVAPEFKASLIPYLKTFIFTLPLDLFFALVWSKMYKCSSTKYMKFFSLMLFFFPLYILPLFLVSSEFYRLRAASVLSQFMIFFYLFYRQDESVLECIEKLGLLLQKYKTLALFILAYFAFSFATLRFSYPWSDFFADFIVSSR